jgi:putative transposase
MKWHNHDHRHSGIRFVSPAERHAGRDAEILARRHALYLQARAANPRRWARRTRNWQPIAAVTLNPERESVVNAAIAWASSSRSGRIFSPTMRRG